MASNLRKLCSTPEGVEEKWLEIGSSEAYQFKENLAKIATMANAPSYCPKCHCFLNNDQKKIHEHKDSKTPSCYKDWADFLTFIKNNNHYRKIEDKEEFKMIHPKPKKSSQTENSSKSASSTQESEGSEPAQENNSLKPAQENSSLKLFLAENKESLVKDNLLLISDKKTNPAKSKESKIEELKQPQPQKELKDDLTSPVISILLDKVIETSINVEKNIKISATVNRKVEVYLNKFRDVSCFSNII